jgi:hypothetical protein
MEKYNDSNQRLEALKEFLPLKIVENVSQGIVENDKRLFPILIALKFEKIDQDTIKFLLKPAQKLTSPPI